MENRRKNNIFVSLAAISVVSFLIIFFYHNVKSDLAGTTYKYKFNHEVKSRGPILFKTSLNNRFYYDNNQVYLHIDLKADKVDSPKERTPLNLAIVIDKSGSMDEKNKLTYVKKAVEHIIDNLDEGDYVSVVAYNHEVSVVQTSTPVSNKYALKEKVNSLRAGGYTNLSGGMLEGYDQLIFKKGYVNRVLLLSDGLANRGITDRYLLGDKVRELNRKEGIVISTFGVGNDFNEDLMTEIAEYGKGNYYYIRNSEQIPDIFAQELNGVRTLVGQSTKVKVRFPDNYLSLNKVYGYPYDINGDEVTIDFKDIFSGQDKTVLLKFNIRKTPKTKIEFECELQYDDVANDFKRIRETEYCSIETVASKYEFEKGYDESVQQSVALFESNDIMEQALKEADLGNYTKAKEHLETGKNYMNSQMNTMPVTPEMKRQLEGMEKYDKELDAVDKKSAEEKSEMQKSGKYENYNTRKNNQ
jgi:Ca-activated chloride channel homolog